MRGPATRGSGRAGKPGKERHVTARGARERPAAVFGRGLALALALAVIPSRPLPAAGPPARASGSGSGSKAKTTKSPTIYHKSRNFRIPFNIDAADRPRLKEVQLWVSDDSGYSWKTVSR